MASPSDDRPTSPADPPRDAIAELFQQGHFRDAVPLAREVLAAHEAELGPDHPELAHPLNRLGVSCRTSPASSLRPGSRSRGRSRSRRDWLDR